jgi:hypothetical protein
MIAGTIDFLSSAAISSSARTSSDAIDLGERNTKKTSAVLIDFDDLLCQCWPPECLGRSISDGRPA